MHGREQSRWKNRCADLALPKSNRLTASSALHCIRCSSSCTLTDLLEPKRTEIGIRTEVVQVLTLLDGVNNRDRHRKSYDFQSTP
jgi:hypothetical protein